MSLLHREAAAAALGYDLEDMTDERVLWALGEFDGWTRPALLKHLRKLEREFDAAGGRGVELADEIDHARIVLAVMSVKTPYVPESEEEEVFEEDDK